MSGDCLAGSMSVMCRAPSVDRRTFSNTEDSPTFMRLKTRSVRKGIWLAPVMVLGEPSQGFAVWDGHGRRGAISSSADVHALTGRPFGWLLSVRSSTSSGTWPPLLIGLAVDVVVLRGFNPRRVGLVDPWHQLVALSGADVSYRGWNRSSNISTASFGATLPRRFNTSCAWTPLTMSNNRNGMV